MSQTAIKVNGVDYPLDDYTATGLAEGFIEADSAEQVVAAWQYLVLTGLAWRLQGFFGRNATQLIEGHIINRADDYNHDEGIEYYLGEGL